MCECFWASVLNAWPKVTKSGSMSCWLCWGQFILFTKGCGCQSSNALIRFLVWKERKIEKGAKRWGAEWDATPPFSVLIYLLLFIMVLLLKLFRETKSKEGRQILIKKLHCAKGSDSTSPRNLPPFLWASCRLLPILPRMHSLHIKRCQVLQ